MLSHAQGRVWAWIIHPMATPAVAMTLENTRTHVDRSEDG